MPDEEVIPEELLDEAESQMEMLKALAEARPVPGLAEFILDRWRKGGG